MTATDSALKGDPSSTIEAPGATPADDPNRVDRALLLAASVVVLGAVMSILDTTVVNVAINTLAAQFHTTLTTIQWVATGYTLALAAVIPLTGWIADRFGTKRLYMTSIALFMLGSCLSGLAWSSTSIIFFRVLQGLGGGMIMPAGMIILTRAAGPGRIGRVMAIMGVPMLLGPILGPILGGWLVTDVSWRWIFFINVPIGLFALAMSRRVLPRDVAAREQKLDLVDFCLLSPGLALMIYGLAKSGSSGGFGSSAVTIPLIAGALLLLAFVWHSLRATNPLVDLRLFIDRTFRTSSVTLLLLAIAVFGSFLLLPLYLQTVRGVSALQTGLLLAPQGFGAMITMPIAGRLSDRTGSGRIVPFGLIVTALAVLMLTQVGADTSYVALEFTLFVFGLGMGFSMMPVFTGAMQSMRQAAVARASTALNIIQQTGTSIGTAVMSVLLASAVSSQLGGGHGTIGSTASLSAAERARIAPQMAAAFGQTFWWALALIAVAFVASLTLPKRRSEVAGDAQPATIPA